MRIRNVGGAVPEGVLGGLNPPYVPVLAPYQAPQFPPPPGFDARLEALRNQLLVDAFAENPYHAPVPAAHENRVDPRREQMIAAAEARRQGHEARLRELQHLNERAVELHARIRRFPLPAIIGGPLGVNPPMIGHPEQGQPAAIDPAILQFPRRPLNVNPAEPLVNLGEGAPHGGAQGQPIRPGFVNDEQLAQWAADYDRERERIDVQRQRAALNIVQREHMREIQELRNRREVARRMQQEAAMEVHLAPLNMAERERERERLARDYAKQQQPREL